MVDRVGQQFGNYLLLRLLGEGNFAEIYLGEHRYLEIPAAIKILHVRMEPGTHASFRREARTIAHLQHPHIVRVLDFGFQEQTPYLVMEYIPNGTLRTLYPKGTRLPLAQIVTYVKQIASALDYAHQQRVIHRDVKPENLLLNAKHEVVLSDFGIAVVQRTLTSLSEQNAAGTPLYMAPEQILHQPCAASDQYALGVMVYEWLCGEPPFRGSGLAVFGQHLYQAPPSLCARLPYLPPAVEDVVFGALAKDPNLRFASVQDFATVLEEACFATQPLPHLQPLSRLQLLERVSRDQHALPTTRSAIPAAPAARAQDSPGPVMSLAPTTPQYRGNIQGPTQPLIPQPVTQRQMASRYVRSSSAHTNRQRLLRRVRAFWITGMLDQSLHGAALMALGLQEQPDAVGNPWHLVLQHPDASPQQLPMGTRITQVYDASDGELLILGAPGSGKTTLLLELARDLLDRAERDAHHPLPMVFNLSSWAMKRQHLTDWLVEELNSKYQVPRKLGQALVDADQILPLLDGLDEVAPKDRTACIETINSYRQEHGLLPLVVCSRSVDYLAQTTRLLLHNAVAVQPLSVQQIDTYLRGAGTQGAALQLVLRRDPDLQELVTTPLMLNVFILAYQGRPLQDITPLGTLPAKQQQVFTAYVQRMLWHRGSKAHAVPEQTIHYLSYLARQMRDHNQTVFYLEHLQPDWLSSGLRSSYAWLAVRLPAILIGMLVSTLVLSFLSGSLLPSFLLQNAILGGVLAGLWCRPALQGGVLAPEQQTQRPGWGKRLTISVFIGLIVGLSFGVKLGLYYTVSDWLRDGLVFGAIMGVSSLLPQRRLGAPSEHFWSIGNRSSGRWRRLARFFQTGHGARALQGGVVIGVCYGISYGLGYDVSLAASLAVSMGLSYGFISLLISLTLGVQAQNIHLKERLRWTWGSLRRKLFASKHLRTTLVLACSIMLLFESHVELSYALSVGLSHALSVGLSHGLSVGLSYGLSVGLSYWFLLGLFQGISQERIEDQERRVSNQGIRRSFRNSVLMGLISGGMLGAISPLSVGLSYALSVGLNFGLSYGRNFGLNEAMLVGVSGGLLVCLLSGGLATLRHYVLRLLLWRTRTFPWQAPQFLDTATERILLRKVGGGYLFVHRLLLDYFAALETGSIPAMSAEGLRGATTPVSPSLARPVSPVQEILPDPPASACSLAPATVLSDVPRLLRCGHERRAINARFCSVCGMPVLDSVLINTSPHK